MMMMMMMMMMMNQKIGDAFDDGDFSPLMTKIANVESAFQAFHGMILISAAIGEKRRTRLLWVRKNRKLANLIWQGLNCRSESLRLYIYMIVSYCICILYSVYIQIYNTVVVSTHTPAR